MPFREFQQYADRGRYGRGPRTGPVRPAECNRRPTNPLRPKRSSGSGPMLLAIPSEFPATNLANPIGVNSESRQRHWQNDGLVRAAVGRRQQIPRSRGRWIRPGQSLGVRLYRHFALRALSL